eukprot:scaffold241_cov340-Pavlova_lutheri.AAC.9
MTNCVLLGSANRTLHVSRFVRALISKNVWILLSRVSESKSSFGTTLRLGSPFTHGEQDSMVQHTRRSPLRFFADGKNV